MAKNVYGALNKIRLHSRGNTPKQRKKDKFVKYFSFYYLALNSAKKKTNHTKNIKIAWKNQRYIATNFSIFGNEFSNFFFLHVFISCVHCVTKLKTHMRLIWPNFAHRSQKKNKTFIPHFHK